VLRRCPCACGFHPGCFRYFAKQRDRVRLEPVLVLGCWLGSGRVGSGRGWCAVPCRAFLPLQKTCGWRARQRTSCVCFTSSCMPCHAILANTKKNIFGAYTTARCKQHAPDCSHILLHLTLLPHLRPAYLYPCVTRVGANFRVPKTT
jgi:hypothetical protein